MSNCYQKITADNVIKCSVFLWDELSTAMSDAAEEAISTDADDHGFDVEYIAKSRELYMFADDFGNPDGLPESVLKIIGKIIDAAGLTFWQFGIAWHNDRYMPAGSAGGTRFRITREGKVVYPMYEWPEIVKGAKDED